MSYREGGGLNVIIRSKEGIWPRGKHLVSRSYWECWKEEGICRSSAEESSVRAVCSLSSNTRSLEGEGASPGHLVQPPASRRCLCRPPGGQTEGAVFRKFPRGGLCRLSLCPISSLPSVTVRVASSRPPCKASCFHTAWWLVASVPQT